MRTIISILTALVMASVFMAGDLGAHQDRSKHMHFSEELFKELEYRMVGPSRGGRVTAVAGHREQPSTFYMGACGGGVWKTTNYGLTWTCVSDGFFATGSIGAIRVADSDPDIVYVATGSDGLRSNVIIGKGVYKSTDAGKTWILCGLEKTGNSGAVLIHPEDPDLVYVAAIGNPFAPNPERGVYRSKDSGSTWEKVLFISDETGAVDLEFAPDDPQTIYASMWRTERKPWTIISGGMEGGVYKSADGGDNWTQLNNGLPQGLRGKSDLAVSAADPNRVYVLIEAPEKEGGLYRSDDRGETWVQVTDYQPIQSRPFYYCNLDAHPTNPEILWAQANGFYKSTDGGKTWKSYPTPHGDNHDMWINPDDPDIFIQSNDGGANITLDGGKTWSSQYNQPTAELYQVDISDGFPYRLYAGQQDNTTVSVPSFPPLSHPGGYTALWESHGGCETGPAVPKPGDPGIVYANCKGRFGVYNRRTGQEQQYYVGFWNIYGHNPKDLAFRFQRVAPIHVSPHDPDKVYHTSQYVHVTTNGGQIWQTISPDLTAFTPETQMRSGGPITNDITGEEHFSTIYEIQESPHEPGVIWVGANDGPIHITRDGGETWKDVTPPELGPYGRVQQIEVSPHVRSKAYACILRYQLGDFEPYVYKTENYGETWTRITTGANGIPGDFPVRVVREDPNREGLLYAGTEFGMFISFDDGLRWQNFQLNLPVTPVTDIKVVDKDLALSTMGRSFWILYDLTPLYEISEQIAASMAYLFSVKAPYRIYAERFSRRLSGPYAPQYPTPGANIDYYLAADEEEEVKLEILDAEGNLVRNFSSEEKRIKPPEETDQTERESEEERSRLRPRPRLAKNAGLHRFVWDLRYPGPWHENPMRSERPGPMVPPGMYQARLTVGHWSSGVSFEVKMDPRVLKEGITESDVRAQAKFAIEVRDTLSEARRAAEHVKSILKEKGGEDEILAAIKEQLISKPGRYEQPMLIDQFEYLYSNSIRADQRPGQDAYDRLDELSKALQEQVSKIRK
jgi:photosystem II stability/assembly factor-like uncharacterized protein